MKIESNYGCIWFIDTKKLSKNDIDFIKSFSPVVYWNDLECYHWAFDKELPSGRWLENMEFSNDFTEVKAIVLQEG